MKNKKRVLHILASNIFSGAENIACTIIKNLNDDYEMVYCSPKGNIENILNEKNIPYYGIDKLSFNNVKKVVNDFKPDIIHAHDFKATFYASFFSKKCKIVSHIHKNDPYMRKVSIKSILYLLCSKKISTIFGVSDSIIEEYYYKDKIKEKFVTLYNYVDKDYVIRLSNEYSIDNKYDLFYLGRLNDEKNPFEFVEIVNKLNDSKIKCVMIGDGPLMDDCKKLINKYNLEDNIELVGFKSNPFPYIKNSKICIMPSKFEGFGITAVESLILDKPVLNSGVGGLKKIFACGSEYVCKNTDDYIKKIKNIKKYSNKKVDISDFTDLSKWKNKIEQAYGGEKNE